MLSYNDIQAFLYAEARAVRAEAAVDELVDKVKAQATKLKSKVETRQIKRTDFSDLMEEMEVDDELGELKIIKRQRFSDDAPISEEQAIKLLEKIAYDFLLFNNSSTGRHSVIYKRKDGFYGIVEPKAPNQNLKVKKSK